MKIYFSSSLRGKTKYGSYYDRITRKVVALGHSLVIDTTSIGSPETVVQETEDEAQEWYSRMLSCLDKSEVAIFEVSRPSTGIGHEIGLAVVRGKPVIALHLYSKKPYVIGSIPNDKVQVVAYTDDTLESELEVALNYAQGQLNQRFTMIMPSDIMSHLNKITESGKSRSEYIRNLIYKDMKEQS